MDTYDVIVIGGGAAGMFAAIQAGYQGARVLLLEPNDRLGKKLYITGKGRCNLTNNCTWQEVLKNVPHNSRFLYSALSGFTPEDTMTFFESLGCEVKTERGNRVFPVSDKSSSVIRALETALGYAGVEIRRLRAREILTEQGRVVGVKTDAGSFAAPSVILATGGCSYPATGSTGDGYRMAARLGHEIVPPVGSLVPLTERGEDCARMQGLSLRNVQIRLLCGGKTVYQEFGELLFTHFGLSGPVILSASAHMEAGQDYEISIDLKPALDEKTLDARILRDFAQQQNRSFENALGGLYPKTMIPVIVRRSGIPGAQKVNAVTKAQRQALLLLTKDFRIPIAGRRPVEEAIITHGGVNVKQVDPKTMQSKLVPGLFFAGELLDVDAYTGGFNLQIAWATGYAAGTAAAQLT